MLDKSKPAALNRRFSVAPMMDWTDRHCRYFHRLLSQQSVLYTEMITTGALIHGDAKRFLDFNTEEQPLALQLGGSNPKELVESAKMAEDWGYQEVNLNVGCPSDRVQNNMMGACLMAEPKLVTDCLAQMQAAVSIPITVKHRIGIDDMDSYEEFIQFVDQVKRSGCQTFIVHARKALLQGLSPKQNREVPPLNYDWVYQLKSLYPQLEIIINGGITNLDEAEQHLQHIDGVMLGRAAYYNPYLMAEVDQRLYGTDSPILSRMQVAEAMLPYIDRVLAKGGTVQQVVRHMLGLFHGQKGGRRFRRYLSENAYKSNATSATLAEALTFIME